MLYQIERPSIGSVGQRNFKRRSIAIAIHIQAQYAISLHSKELYEVHVHIRADAGCNRFGNIECADALKAVHGMIIPATCDDR